LPDRTHRGYASTMTNLETHGVYEKLLGQLVADAGVSADVLGRVLERVMVQVPDDVPRADIAKGTMLARRTPINPGAVSKAVGAMAKRGVVTDGDLTADENRAGRPIKPVHLGSGAWGLLGIKVVHEAGKTTGLVGVATSLRVFDDVLAGLEMPLPQMTFTNMASEIKDFTRLLINAAEQKDREDAENGVAEKREPRKWLGVGIDVAGHVHDGHAIDATQVGQEPGDTFDLTSLLFEAEKLPVVVDNDVNLLAVRETYSRRFPERDMALVAVLEDGIGASLILNAHVYRGGGGMAGEPGHLPVLPMEEPKLAPRTTPLVGRGFDSPCHCNGHEHVDCYAVPARLCAENGATSLAGIAGLPARDENGDLTRPGWTFKRGGDALGQSIASIINIVNPSRMVLLLPPELGPDVDLRGGSAAAEYRLAAEDAVTKYSFSNGAQTARAGRAQLTVEVIHPAEVPWIGARLAALRVLDDFVLHARKRDGCHLL
jgi:predicted NBD/HSP70 family sugar kinase